MPDLKSIDNIYLILLFIVPGLIIVWVRSLFITGRVPSTKEAILPYLALSVTYYAVVLPIVEYVLSFREPGHEKALAWFGLVFVGPFFVGFILGIVAQYGWVRTFLRWMRLHIVHNIPTAWDWKFTNMPAQWVLVTLKDGTKFYGFCGANSFMSSDPKERDLYVERIYDVNDQNEWTSRGDNGVLISGGEVRSIEFWPAEAN